jgi:putative endonuclease
MESRRYYVYILASPSGTLYIGVTNNLEQRVFQHRRGSGSTFARRHRCTRLVYFEETDRIDAAIFREKEIKAWRRAKKEALIVTMNPDWEELMP